MIPWSRPFRPAGEAAAATKIRHLSRSTSSPVPSAGSNPRSPCLRNRLGQPTKPIWKAGLSAPGGDKVRNLSHISPEGLGRAG